MRRGGPARHRTAEKCIFRVTVRFIVAVHLTQLEPTLLISVVVTTATVTAAEVAECVAILNGIIHDQYAIAAIITIIIVIGTVISILWDTERVGVERVRTI